MLCSSKQEAASIEKGHLALTDTSEEEETEEERLNRLLEEQAADLTGGDTLSPVVLREWLRWERFKDRCQWMPQRLGLADPAGGFLERLLTPINKQSYVVNSAVRLEILK